MRIIVPTRGRVGRQRTLDALPPSLLANTTVVCPEDEAHRHERFEYFTRHGVEIVAQPANVVNISQKRAWIMRHWNDLGVKKIVMLDDDLKFVHRREDVPDRLRPAERADFEYWFGELEKILSPDIPHAGFGPRMGNNNQPAGWSSPGRMMFSLGYYLPTVIENVILERVRFREDMDVTLQLLRKGFPNMVGHTFVQGQEGGKYGEEGGCSDERDVAASDAEAQLLADFHPGLVKVVDKNYKGSAPRKEVICYWQRALKQGMSDVGE